MMVFESLKHLLDGKASTLEVVTLWGTTARIEAVDAVENLLSRMLAASLLRGQSLLIAHPSCISFGTRSHYVTTVQRQTEQKAVTL